MAIKQKELPTIITDPNVSATMRMGVNEYKEWSKSNGRIMGRLPNQKTYPTEEEMAMLIKSGYTRADIKEKHGLNDKEIDAVLVSMSHKERRDKVVVLH